MGCRASRRTFLWSASSSRPNSPCDASGTNLAIKLDHGLGTYADSTEEILLLFEGCRDIGHVALDPLPGIRGLGAVGFASLGREHFIQVLLSEYAPPTLETVGVAS